MATRLHKYAAINAKLRTRMSKFLQPADFERLIRADSIESALSLLSAFGYEKISLTYEAAGELQACEYELLMAEIDDLGDIKKYVRDEILTFVETLSLRYEVDTLKKALRIWQEKSRGRSRTSHDERYLLRGFHNIKVERLVEASDIEDVLRTLSGTAYHGLICDLNTSIAVDKTLFQIEIALDNYYFAELTKAISKLSKEDKAIASRLIGVEVDMENLDRILRFREMFGFSEVDTKALLIPSEYGSKAAKMHGLLVSGDPADSVAKYISSRYQGLSPLLSSKYKDRYSKHLMLERIMDEVISLEVRRVLTAYPFTLGIILSYFILKRRETKRITLILNAIFYNLKEDRIQSLL